MNVQEMVRKTFLKFLEFTLIQLRKKDILHDFNLNVREREILGIAGVDGNGQQQFVEVLNALLKETKGKNCF